MSDEESQAPKPPKPMKKTSAVPLKKETVRVTLKATPEAPGEEAAGDASDAPAAPKAPSAPKPPTAKKPGGAPPAPAPTIPLKTAKGSEEGGAPAAPAPTVKLATPGAPSAPKTSPLKTAPLQTGGPGTQELPKATVQLGGTQALGAPTALSKTQPSFGQVDEDEDEEAPDKLATIMSIVAFVGALLVLTFQAMAVSEWEGWAKLFE